MKASELRIGNLISWNSSGDIEKVMKIEPSFVNSVSESDLNPILLTEEWLFKAGGKMNNEEITIPINRNVYISFYDECCQLVTDDGFLIADMEYIHQLQNIYFSLTGEELKIK